MTNKNLMIGLVVAILIAIGGYLFPQIQQSLGGTTNYDSLELSETLTVTGATTLSASLKVGTSGTTMSQILSGTCTLGTLGPASIDASHAASTTKVYDCPVTGVVSGDNVIASFSTSTATIVNGWSIQGAKASSTAGYIEVLISNLTGTARVPSATGVGSSTSYIIIR